MGRIYTSQFQVAVAAPQDLFDILGDTDSAVLIHEIHFGQDTDVKDAEEELLSILIKRGVGSTVGSGGTTPPMEPRLDGDAAAGSVVRANDTTIMSVGTIETLYALVWNVRVPLEKIWTPETRPMVSPGDRMTFELESTPADTFDMRGTLVFEEIGG